MTQEDIITPIATVATRQCMITSPRFCAEYRILTDAGDL